MNRGKVFLIGAGPGDPGLLTLRGRDCLAQADVVVYDYLVNPALLAHAAPRARRIFAGKRKGESLYTQDEINALLVREARRGRIVARLKGGDPFIFGRGGEEALALAAQRLPFEVVPGVSSASGVPAYAGIPLTHRGLSATVIFTTGHEDPSRSESMVPWDEVLARKGTLVFLMGVTHLAEIIGRLIRHGRAPSTPVAVIRWGSWPNQRTIVGTLADIVARCAGDGLAPPGIIVVGEVVRLRPALNWFETKPLFRERILVTRPKEQAGELVELLRAQGAAPIELPAIQLAPPRSFSRLDRAIRRIERYHWLIFTSANGVEAFFHRLRFLGRDLRILKGIRLCAIGPKTAAAIERRGLFVDVVPTQFVAEGVLAALARYRMRGRQVLIPRAEEAREILPQQLTARGAIVDVAPAYRTVRAPIGRQGLRKLLQAHAVSVITFTSSSTVRSLIEALGRRAAASLLAPVKLAAIGPITAATLREYGLEPQIVSESSTAIGLVQAIVEHVRGAARPPGDPAAPEDGA